MLHQSLSHLDRGSGAVRIIFLDFCSAFNTIQSLLLREKLMKMGVGSHLVVWITDYLTARPLYVQLGDCRSDTVVSSMGVPQGTELSIWFFSGGVQEIDLGPAPQHHQDQGDGGGLQEAQASTRVCNYQQ